MSLFYSIMYVATRLLELILFIGLIYCIVRYMKGKKNALKHTLWMLAFFGATTFIYFFWLGLSDYYTDYRPDIDKECIIGKWVKGESVLHLYENGTFDLQDHDICIQVNKQDTKQWSIDNNNLYLIFGQKKEHWRIIKFLDTPRIIDDWHGFDSYIENLGFGKVDDQVGEKRVQATNGTAAAKL